MFDWWVVRVADKTGKLSAREWESLMVAGNVLTLPARSKVKWRSSTGGVMLVKQGSVSLFVKSTYSQHLLKLHRGDMAGTLHPVTCQLEAITHTVVYTFTHQEWLAALTQMPMITHKLLNGMASCALQLEATISESG